MKNIKTFEAFTDLPEPRINSVVYHKGAWKEDDPNYPCHVYITSGNYYSNGRMSNHWSWKRISTNGDLSENENGYGSFSLPGVVMDDVYSEEEIKEIYPHEYEKYLMKNDVKKFNI